MSELTALDVNKAGGKLACLLRGATKTEINWTTNILINLDTEERENRDNRNGGEGGVSETHDIRAEIKAERLIYDKIFI
jgi:hypothetical protein